MRLIDADEVLTGIEELKISPWATDTYMFPHELAVKEALEIVRDLCVNQSPTIDAVEVVRCKDCIHEKSTKRVKHLTGLYWCEYNSQPCNADDFCSYGEREGDGHDE